MITPPHQLTESQNISSITKGPRQSNFELLRLFAMLMVITIHTYITKDNGIEFSRTGYMFESFIHSLCIVAVNVFILISGWFGIKPTAKGFVNFAFQCVFFLIVCLAATDIFVKPIPLKTLAAKIYIAGGWWFVRCYIGLYIISPILNAYVEKASKNQLGTTLLFLFIIQTFWGWTHVLTEVNKGYSVFTFASLYLLARFIRIHCRKPKHITIPLLCYLGSSILNLGLYLSLGARGATYCMDYCNPLIIIGAVSLLLVFSQIKIKPNKTINRLSLSAFAVYLFHQCYGISDIFFYLRNLIYENLQGWECIVAIAGLILTFYVAGIIIDQPRILLWRRYGKRFTSICQRITEWFITKAINLVQ